MDPRRCPRCTFTLAPEILGGAEIDFCPRCRGTWVERAEGKAFLGPFGDFSTWAQSGSATLSGTSRLRCPEGHGKLSAWRVEVPDGSQIEVDVCGSCRGLWLDSFEAQRLRMAGPKLQAALPARPAGATAAVDPGSNKATVGWYFFQLFTSMPLEVYNPKRRTAVVCLSLIAVNVAVFFLEVMAITNGDEASIHRFSAVGDDLVRGRHLDSVLTHMFMHGGIAHLLGNMWFLWTYGDNVEDRVGRGRFLGLYVLFGLAALGLQMALMRDTSIPLLGASGAISGLMGAYLGLFPRARIYQVFFFIRWKLPVWFSLGTWVGINVLNGVAEEVTDHKGGGVAWWAHIGGFAAGLLWAVTFGRRFRDGAELQRLQPP